MPFDTDIKFDDKPDRSFERRTVQDEIVEIRDALTRAQQSGVEFVTIEIAITPLKI